jgi:hypothetical protein
MHCYIIYIVNREYIIEICHRVLLLLLLLFTRSTLKFSFLVNWLAGSILHHCISNSSLSYNNPENTQNLNCFMGIFQLIFMPEPNRDKWTEITKQFEERWNFLTSQGQSMGYIPEYNTYQVLDQFLVNINFTNV